MVFRKIVLWFLAVVALSACTKHSVEPGVSISFASVAQDASVSTRSGAGENVVLSTTEAMRSKPSASMAFTPIIPTMRTVPMSSFPPMLRRFHIMAPVPNGSTTLLLTGASTSFIVSEPIIRTTVLPSMCLTHPVWISSVLTTRLLPVVMT